MQIESVDFVGHGSFRKHWVGLSSIKPINIIIGRNNTGKSQFLDLLSTLCRDQFITSPGRRYRCVGTLTAEELSLVFPENTDGGRLRGNHWRDHGSHFVDKVITWEINDSGAYSNFKLGDGSSIESFNPDSTQERINKITTILQKAKHRFAALKLRHLFADRDIRPEKPNTSLPLEANGTGATNIIRRYITTTSSAYPRELIQKKLLNALNEIYGSDGHFSEIQVKHHDEKEPLKDCWEVYLGEEKKGLIPLSQSGSGLKTVILVLLNLLVVPEISRQPKASYVFAFEELENNLHPALQRRLLQYIENFALTEKVPVFLTTHSSTALDLFGVSPHAQIIHITHDGETAKATKIEAHFDQLGVISELGARPSDLLQANGIIWVEGPSDCVYINRWISLYTNNALHEGRDYQCAFYGGALLSRTQFRSPDEAQKELVNLFRLNPNIIVVCDRDKAAPRTRLKERVQRIRAEIIKIPNAHIWITGAREIENYIPGSAISKAMNLSALPDPSQYEMFFPRKAKPEGSYIERNLKRKMIDKVELALLCTPHMDKATMDTRFDWPQQLRTIIDRVKSWNR